MASMEYALGTGGGFCVGSTFIIEPQRLAGLGKSAYEISYLKGKIVLIDFLCPCYRLSLWV